MSPFVLVRSVPYTAASLGGPSEEDSDERERFAGSGDVGASGQRGVEAGAGGRGVRAQLPTGEADLAALSGRRGGGGGASPRGEGIEPRVSEALAAAESALFHGHREERCSGLKVRRLQSGGFRFDEGNDLRGNENTVTSASGALDKDPRLHQPLYICLRTSKRQVQHLACLRDS